MEKEEVQKLLNLRSFLVDKYQSLSRAIHATTDNKNIAEILERSVSECDAILKTYVNFD